MHSKLILVEGIPGSGKSTFAQKIADCYSTRGQKQIYTRKAIIIPPTLPGMPVFPWKNWTISSPLTPHSEPTLIKTPI